MAGVLIDARWRGINIATTWFASPQHCLLEATKQIDDDKLRNYVVKFLGGDNPDIKIDGRATRNKFRDFVIWRHRYGRLFRQDLFLMRRKPKRPQLRLVVNNPPRDTIKEEAA